MLAVLSSIRVALMRTFDCKSPRFISQVRSRFNKGARMAGVVLSEDTSGSSKMGSGLCGPGT